VGDERREMSSVDSYYDDSGEGGSGWPEFAAVLLFALGFFRIISAIAYFADSRRIDDLSGGLFGDQIWAWGLWDLGIAALAFFAGMSLIKGGTFGRIVAYAWAALAIVQGFSTIQRAPWYSAFAIALAVMIIYGLARTPRRARA
jgi:hypothetical protein